MRVGEVVGARNATFCHKKCVSKARCLDLCERACCGGSLERFDHARIVFLVAGRFFAQILTLHLFQGISPGCIVFKPLPCVAVAFFSLCTVNCHFFWLKFYVSGFLSQAQCLVHSCFDEATKPCQGPCFVSFTDIAQGLFLALTWLRLCHCDSRFILRLRITGVALWESFLCHFHLKRKNHRCAVGTL